MRAGQLNRLVSIRQPSVTTYSTDGQPILGYTTLLSGVWADKQPISGRELFTQDIRWAEVTTRFILRYVSTSIITPECVVIDLADSSAEYNIDSVINIDDRDRGVEILAHKAS